ncbi:MAG: peptidyl-prolyl cis-trans isomerase D [Elusimicrobia bacterium]|nr:MAG: peptidyl-prolyl cis-trans isomerase D [Elusimicrobiota bacterium]KAF0153708.1 MAG: peptidyl-prolyl cis-trans isomerase D [Elusimicrobiota bacterium]
MKIINSFLALALTAAPAAAQRAVDGVAAKVNGEPILISEYNKTRQAILEQYRAMMPDFLKQKDAEKQLETMAMDKLVDELLLTQQADKLKIKVYDRELEAGVAEIKKRFARDEAGRPVSPEKAEAAFGAELAREGVSAAQFRERIRKQLMVRKLIEEKIRPQVSAPDEKEVRAYYDKIQSAVKGDTASLGMDKDDLDELNAVAQRFKEVTAERVRLRHILVKVAEGAPLAEKNKAREKSLALKKRLDAGTDFEELAEKESDDQESARKGGDLGYVFKGWLPDPVEEAAFSMRVGDNSGPVESPFGWHILRLEEKRARQKLRFEAARDDIEQLLANSKFSRKLTEHLNGLKEKASIQFFGTK